AINNTAIGSVHRDRDGCNDKLYLSSQVDGATRMVVSAGSRTASVNVPAVCDLFASVWTGHALEQLILAPTDGNMRVLASKSIELFGIDTLKQDVLRSFRSLKEKLIAKQLPQAVRSMSRGEAEQTLRAAQGRFEGRVEESIVSIHDKLLAFYADQAIPKLV